MPPRKPPTASPRDVPGSEPGKRPGRVRRFFAELGPGLITGAADDDPSGISTYSVAGASFGYAPLWTALFSFPLMTAVQLMCARHDCPHVQVADARASGLRLHRLCR